MGAEENNTNTNTGGTRSTENPITNPPPPKEEAPEQPPKEGSNNNHNLKLLLNNLALITTVYSIPHCQNVQAITEFAQQTFTRMRTATVSPLIGNALKATIPTKTMRLADVSLTPNHVNLAISEILTSPLVTRRTLSVRTTRN